MNYTLLRQGDKLPSVGVLQKLLNSMGENLRVDGEYGYKTYQAVRKFQTANGLFVDGAVGSQTWPRLTEESTLPILDCIDVFDPSLYNLERADIVAAGGNPVLIGGMSNGVVQAVTEILKAASNDIFLLRFHGHGAPGDASISSGHGDLENNQLSSINTGNFDVLKSTIARLKPIFGPYGNVQFMHCEAGNGARGKAFLKEIADTLEVPVSAAVETQFGGGLTTFRFEGPTHTAVPGGSSLKSWCTSRQNFAAECAISYD